MSKYNKELLIKVIQDFHLAHNRSPKSTELGVRIETFKRYFGTYHNAVREAGLVPLQRNIPDTKVCERCSKEFKPKSYEQKYCSRSCAAATNNQQRLKTKYCLWCDKLLSSHRKTFCSRSCCNEYNHYKKTTPRIERGEISDRGTLKRYLIRRNQYQCSQCGVSKWMDNRLPLELDHVDGDATNNYPSNLRLLCPNCHSITPTWKSKNKGNGRQSKGLRSC